MYNSCHESLQAAGYPWAIYGQYFRSDSVGIKDFWETIGEASRGGVLFESLFKRKFTHTTLNSYP